MVQDIKHTPEPETPITMTLEDHDLELQFYDA